MKIDRIEDKKFQIEITEDEALKLADESERDFLDHKMMVNRVGNHLISYLVESCKFPHDKRTTLQLKL